MPCDRVYYTTINLEVARRDLLIIALRELRMEPVEHLDGRVSFHALGSRATLQVDGRLTLEADVAARVVPQIKQAYAAQCVAQAAQTFGWRTRQKAANQVVLTRRA